MCDLPIWIQDFIGEISRDHTHFYFSSWTITIGCSHARRYQTRKSSDWIKTEKTPKIKKSFFYLCHSVHMPNMIGTKYHLVFVKHLVSIFSPEKPHFLTWHWYEPWNDRPVILSERNRANVWRPWIAHQSSVIHFKVTLLQNNFMVFEYYSNL